MFQRRVFLFSLVLSLILNAVVFGYLFKFEPVKPKKERVIDLSFEAVELKSSNLDKQKASEETVKEGKRSFQKNQKEKIPKRERIFTKVSRVKKSRKKTEKERSRKEKGRLEKRKEVKQIKQIEREKPKESPLPSKSSEIKKSSTPVSSQKEKRREENLKRPVASGTQKVQTPSGSPPVKSRLRTDNSSESVIKKGVQQKSAKKGSKEESRENYLKLLLAEIEKNKFYPLIARKIGIEGKVKLKVVVGSRGELLSVKVLSSDSSILERAAVKTLKRCHFPPPPNGKFETELTIRYKLN